MTTEHPSDPKGLVELQELTSFIATVGLHRNETTVDIRLADGLPSIARMSKAGPLRKRASYALFTGPGLSRMVGQISASGAQDADGAPVGIVNLSGGRKSDSEIHPLTGGLTTYASDNPTKWRIVQPGLPPLVGHPVDRAARLNYNRVTGTMDRFGFGVRFDYAGLLTFGFSGPGCGGFSVAVTSRKARLDVTAHDSRVDRRLILACLSALTLKVMRTARGEAVDVLSYLPGRRKA